MKLLISTIRICCLLVLVLLVTKQGLAQINVNQTPKTATCSLNGANVTISVPTEVLTGDNIPLNITLPGAYSASCVKKVTITAGSNLQFQNSGSVALQPLGDNVFETVTPLPGNDGQNFNVFFKFPPYVTCNGAKGTFNVLVELDCGGQQYQCNTTVEVTARADNYWTVTKQYQHGDMVCGISTWRILVTHNNPNPSGLGTYSISGTLQETIGLDIVSGGLHNVNIPAPVSNGSYAYTVLVRNCVPEGSIITNTADYELELGNNCGTLTGTVSAQSPPIQAPNGSISFVKYVKNALNTNLTPGCQGEYIIQIHNNGNIPWTDIEVMDNLNIPGITLVGAPIVPAGWTTTNSGGIYTFHGNSYVLNVGATVFIRIPFQIDSTTPVGSTISNTATIQYQAYGSVVDDGDPEPNTACPGIDCPIVGTAVQNTSSTTTFVVEEPRAIPSIKKCIINPPNALTPPIYQIGDTITFQVQIMNQGSAPLSTVISDALGIPNQNLQIVPSSIQYDYFSDILTGYINTCNYSGVSTPLPFTVTSNTADLQNPTFTVSNMPGICQLNKGNMLRITFDAVILPQMHGTKTNTAQLTHGTQTLSSSVTYAVDQIGVLQVHKRADQDYVENGQNFNYIIEVTNEGSVPLDKITITDALPECVRLNGNISAINALGNNVTYTNSGNINLQLNPTEQLAPGNSITISIPVQKVSGSNCCNVTVSATGVMTTSQVQLSANFGSELEPAACVRSVECCDVDGFEAQLLQRNGKFYVQITGGSVPLQEVDITMLDFHVEYSSPDCKPANMGVFGQLSSNSNTLGGLVLTTSPMPSGSLSWGLGTPSVINNTLEFEVTQPGILDIPCCEYEMTFCIKIRVKDVNCNVCEKTLCYTAEPTDPPCNLDRLVIKPYQKLCPGETIHFSWSGSSPSGGVDIYLVNANNPSIHYVIATGISNGTNNFSYTIPADFPCGPRESWYIVIKDPKSDCLISSDRFVVDCCDQHCDCGRWKSEGVKITQVLSADNGNVQFERSNTLLQKATAINVGIVANCGEKVMVKKGSYVLTAPNYVCAPENCAVTYEWKVEHVNSGAVVNGTGKNFAYQFANPGVYNITITPVCGGKRCEPCRIQVHVRGLIGTPWPADVLPGKDKVSLLP